MFYFLDFICHTVYIIRSKNYLIHFCDFRDIVSEGDRATIVKLGMVGINQKEIEKNHWNFLYNDRIYSPTSLRDRYDPGPSLE